MATAGTVLLFLAQIWVTVAPKPETGPCAGCSTLAAPMSESVPSFAAGVFDTSDFPPRWQCGTWSPLNGWLHIVSDLGIWLAYVAIPAALLFFVRKRRDLPFKGLFLLFCAFILLCGATHLLEAAMFWWPAYRFMGVVKLATAVVSIITVIVLFPIIPKALALRTQAELEREIQQRNHAVQASHAKSEFLANMSHEIRTPLTAILGYAETLTDNLKDADNRDAANTIRRNGQHLLGVVNDILDLAKVEAGHVTIESNLYSPCDIAEDVGDLMRVRANCAGLSLSVEYNGPIPETIRTDPNRLRQILINLVSNAIRFTQRGGVRLIVEFSGDELPPRIRFDVVDTGIGMTPEQIAKLFHPFSQADDSASRRYGGTGLGLTISKRYAEALGGDIQIIETRPNQGSRIRLTIAVGPLHNVKLIVNPTPERTTSHSDADSLAATGSIQDARILLVEDSPDNQRLLAHILNKAGANVTVMENGKLGLDAALDARDQARPFDVILMDLQMPEMDGYTATRRLREAQYKGFIIALTAHAMEGDRQKCLCAGCDDYATKPIDRKRLIAIVAKHLSPKDATAVATHRSRA